MGFSTGTGFVQSTCALTNHKTGTDILLVRRARACNEGTSSPAAATDCGESSVSANKPYVQVSLCSSETTTYDMAVGSSSLALKKKDCSTTSQVRQYYVNIYYVSTDNGNGVNVPTLKKISLEPGAGTTPTWTTTPLVEGIEQFHVEYGLDTSGDGAVDSYTAAPADATA